MTDAAPDYPLASATWAEATRQLNPMVRSDSTDFAAGIPAPATNNLGENLPDFAVGIPAPTDIATPRGGTNSVVADEQGHDEFRPRETVLQEAARTADGPREAIYGHPAQHFKATGRMWAAILTATLGVEINDLPGETVALMFDADKTIRLCETPGHRDSLVDKVGYTRCYERVWDHSS